MSGNTIDRARGRWAEILPLLGIDPRFLVNKHGPCPLCGGRDRFRFDDKDGSGSYICGQCGAGNGVILLRKMHGWSFKEAADEIDRVIGSVSTSIHSGTSRRREVSNTDRLSKLERVLDTATKPSLVREYLATRGLSTVPDVLKGHPALAYVDDGEFVGRFPAMVAPIVGPDGSLQSVHRTYLADLPSRKKIMPAVNTINGGAVRLFDVVDEMGVAEGIETAIAAYELFGIPTWAALSTNGLETFEPPESVKMITVFADNDTNFAGQKSAFTLANRLARNLAVDVMVPDEAGTDWLDFLNERQA